MSSSNRIGNANKTRRIPPAFSEILTPHSSCKSLHQIHLNTQKPILHAEKNKEKLPAPVRKPQSKKNANNTPTMNGDKVRDRCASTDEGMQTSQNHIISDYYIQKILHSASDALKNAKDEESKKLFQGKIERFLGVIFNHKESDKLEIAKKRLYASIEGKYNRKIVAEFAMYVAANASNNAVEGDASANSAIGKHMDAPTDSQGVLYPHFSKIRDAFLDLSISIIRFGDLKKDQKKSLFFHIISAISPCVAYNSDGKSTKKDQESLAKKSEGRFMRSSIRPYLWERDKTHNRSYSSPPRLLDDFDKHFANYDSEKNVSNKINNTLSEPQKEHCKQNLVYKRSSSRFR